MKKQLSNHLSIATVVICITMATTSVTMAAGGLWQATGGAPGADGRLGVSIQNLGMNYIHVGNIAMVRAFPPTTSECPCYTYTPTAANPGMRAIGAGFGLGGLAASLVFGGK